MMKNINKIFSILIVGILCLSSFVHQVQAEETVVPTGSVSQDGIDYSVSIAKSLDGSRPADGVFANSDSIDLANVTRFDMFYAYLKIDYANNSGADLTSTSITMQLPKQGEAGYYEPIGMGSTAPPNWITYPNTPTGDGNTNFPAGNMTTNTTSRLMTWTGTTINDGSTGTIYIKIPMRDPFTKFGLVDYKPVLNYTKGGVASTIEENSQFDIAGQNDQPTFSVSKVNDLGFVPSEPDANQYFYVKYSLASNYSPNYILPKLAHQFDRHVSSTPTINLSVPVGAEIVSLPDGTTVSGNIIKTGGYFGTPKHVVLRYLKTDYPDPNQNISFGGLFNGRFVGDALPTQDVSGSEYTLTHPIGTGSVIPAATLGSISATSPNWPISEDALKVGSVPFTMLGPQLLRAGDTIAGDELNFEYNGIEYVKDGNPLPTDYGITVILLQSASWTGNLDPNNPMSGSVTVYFDDGSFEVLTTFDEAYIVNASGGRLYTGNVPGVISGYQPPEGKIAKKVAFNFNNVPQGFKVSTFVNGYVTGYPTGGADSLRFIRNINLYGKDTGLGRPLATGSGDTSYNVNIVKNTSFQPAFSMERSSAGTVNPGQTDTLKLQTYFSSKATQSFVNPEFDVLLPAGYTFDSYADQTNETYLSSLNVFNLPDGRLKDTPPVIETITNYNGTGRMLVRIHYTGILQNDERMGGLLTIKAAQYMSPGNYTIDGYFAAENIGTVNNLSNTYTPYTVDVNDMNGNGQINDYIFGTVSKPLTISRGVGTSLYSQVQGSYDPSLTGQGTTKQNTIVDGALTLEYNGATPMNTIQLLSILPYEGDGKTLYGGTDNGQRVTLTEAVDVSAYPGATVYYNNTPTDNPSDAGWTTTYSNTAQSVRIVLPPAFALLSGAVEKVSVPLKLQVPGTTDPTLLSSVQGEGYLPIKTYSNTNPAGLDGASSSITSLALGINVQVFKDDNGNGIKEATESWANNAAVDIFNLSDDPLIATPLYSGTTNTNGVLSFLDGFTGINFNLQGYRVVVHMPNENYTFVSGVGNVTTDVKGYQGAVFNTSNQIINVISAFSPKTMSISGNYWQDYEATPNGMKDAHDLLTNVVARTVRLFNVTDNVYESTTTTIQVNGTYTLPNVVVGPEYRVEFAYNSTNEIPSVIADNVVTKFANNILGYTFDSDGMAQDTVQTVNAAIIENGTINVKFSTNGTDTIGSSVPLTRGLPSTYTANIGTTQDITGQTSGTFVVPSGYRLLATEPTTKDATIDNTTKSDDIVFLVELLDPNLSGVKTSTPATSSLHPGDEITYTITISNSGNEEALDTIITDKVPALTELVSIGDGGTIDGAGLITWTIPTIAADEGSVSVNFTVKTLAKQDSGRWNVVNDQATFNSIPVNTTSDEVTQGLLTTEKTSQLPNLSEVLPGGRIDYTIKVSNTGAAVIQDILVADKLPAGTVFVEGSMSSGGVLNQDTVNFTIASLAPGENVEVGFSVLVPKDAIKGSTVENIAQVNGVDTNQVIHTVGELKSNLNGVKTSTPSTSNLHPDDEIVYTITVNNTGNGAAINTIITDKVPAFTELVNIDNGGTIDADGLITWTIPTIAEDGGSVSVNFTVKTLAKQDSGRWNVINDQAMLNGIAINTTSDEVTQGLLTFEKTSQLPNLSEVLPGSRIDYKIKVSNTGADVMRDILVTDILPTHTTFEDGSIIGEGVLDKNNVSFTIASLAPGESLEVGFSVLVAKDAKKGSTIENIAQVNGVDTNQVMHYVGEILDDTTKDELPKTGEADTVLFSSLILLMSTTLLAIAKRKKVLSFLKK